MSPRTRTTRVRIPGVGRLPDGEARKVLVPSKTPGVAPREVLLVRLEGKLHALDSLCPHEGGRLAEGPLWDGCYVSCPLHLYRFEPGSGAAVEVDCDPATVYPVVEVDGVGEIELPEDELPEGETG